MARAQNARTSAASSYEWATGEFKSVEGTRGQIRDALGYVVRQRGPLSEFLNVSARLHNLDPELYLREFIRVLPHWPKDRYLELSPKYWAATRARLNANQLAVEYGDLAVPEPLAHPPEEKTVSN